MIEFPRSHIGKQMNRSDLIKQIAERTNTSQRVVGEVLDAALDSITEAVGNGYKVVLLGFGTFERSQRPAREGRNPKTGESVSIPATTVPKFSAGKHFKERVNR